MKSQDIETFTKHFKDSHIFTCETCKKEFGTNDELKTHLDSNHRHVCNICSEAFTTQTNLECHTNEKHRFTCTLCTESFNEASRLTVHMNDKHSFDCGHCEFKGTTTLAMEEHILEKHISPNENNLYTCDECDFSCQVGKTLLTHFKDNHNENTQNDQIVETNITEEEHRHKEEVKLLKNNFERLESLLQEALDENNKIKSEYEAKLIDANDKLRVTKTENEELKEKVDVLFKLGRGYINKYERKSSPDVPNNQVTSEDRIETVDIEEVIIDEGGNEDLQAWTKNKLRGFKRSGPTSKAEIQSNSKQNPKPSKPTSNERTNPASPSPAEPVGPTPAQPGVQSSENNFRDERPMYCHYFSNQGKCSYEERNGSRCRFIHGDAPMCQSGAACKRAKCMYKHPNMAGRRTHFLGQKSGIPANLNPWMMMMNPWLNSNPNQMQMPNPWNMDRRQ